jgi:serine/threonine protein kinase
MIEPKYIIKPINIFFGYNKNYNDLIGVFEMEHINKYNTIKNKKNYTLKQFIIDNYYRDTFINDFFIILKKICEILIFYQEKSGFIHGDLNIQNILLIYEYDINGNLIYDNIIIKLIDFTFSSIIFKINNKDYLLQYFDISYRYNINISNPYNLNLWRYMDLFFMFIRFTIYINDKIFEDKIIKINEKLIEIFNFNKNSKEIFENKYNEIILKNKNVNFTQSNFSRLIPLNKNLRDEIFGENAKYYLLNPVNLIKVL